MPQVPFGLEPSSRNFLIDGYLGTNLEILLPMPALLPIEEFVSEMSTSLIFNKADMLHAKTLAGRFLKFYPCKFALHACFTVVHSNKPPSADSFASDKKRNFSSVVDAMQFRKAAETL